MRKYLCLTSLLVLLTVVHAQQKQDVINYIERYKDVAIQEMLRSHIPASITLAQGLHESSYGKSRLAKEANNHFGIKCKDEWSGKKFFQNDDAPNECFRVYEHAEASYADHSDFLLTRPRYASLFQLPITDYKGWALGLKEAGYATNPKYTQILVKTIEENELTKYDQTGLALMEEKEKMLSAPVKSNTLSVSPANTTTEQINASVTKRSVTMVNGLRAVKATTNEDPLKIAFEFNIDFSSILLFNDLADGDVFKDGENVFLQPKKTSANTDSYVVIAGESMHDISQKMGIKLRELYNKNNMKSNDQVVAGETLALKNKRNAAPRTITYAQFLKTQTQKSDNTQSLPHNNSFSNTAAYKVQQSDTLYSIARKFNTSVEKLKDINNLSSNEITPGQTIVVSQ
jgi:LysM repeat protein